MEQGVVLRQARLRARMTQDHVARAAGVSAKTISRAEAGALICAENARAICAVLGLDAAHLPLGDLANVSSDGSTSTPARTESAAKSAATPATGRGVASLLLTAALVWVFGWLASFLWAINRPEADRSVLDLLNENSDQVVWQTVWRAATSVAEDRPVSTALSQGIPRQTAHATDGSSVEFSLLKTGWRCCSAEALPTPSGWAQPVFLLATVFSPWKGHLLTAAAGTTWIQTSGSHAKTAEIGPLSTTACRRALDDRPLRFHGKLTFALRAADGMATDRCSPGTTIVITAMSGDRP